MAAPSRRKKRPRPTAAGSAYRRRLESLKRASTLQLLFKAARLADEEALRRVAAREGAPRLRRAHTALLPHIDLDGTRITDLAERVGVSKQAVSEVIDELESAGVVERTRDPDDARAKRVAFTPRGLDGLLRGLDVLREFERELAQVVGEHEMQNLRATLLALLEHLEEPGKTR